MKQVRIHKGGKEGKEAAPVHIKIEYEFPIHDQDTLREVGALYQKQAEILCDALLASLPQGTSDRLLAELLKRKASYLVFPQEDG